MARNLTGRLLTGGLIILVGVLLLLSTTGIAETSSIWDWFPAIFVLLGLWALVRSEFRNLIGPIMVIAIAGTFFLRNLELISDAAIGTWWPLFLVLFGLLFMLNRSSRRDRHAGGPAASGDVTAVGIFGGGDRRLTTETFTGGDIVAIFGGVDLDLRDVSIPVPPAVIDTICLFGGSEIRVPETWEVRLDVLAIFGEASDTRPRRGQSSDSNEPDLLVTGIVLFGGVEVRD